MATDWNSIPDPGSIALNRPQGFACPGDLPNSSYSVEHGMIPLVGGILSVGDVWQFTAASTPLNAPLATGTSYSVLSIALYEFAACTVTTTSANAPDSVTLSPGGVVVSVDYLLANFSRLTAANLTKNYGNQVPAPTSPIPKPPGS
jgi:hypothetical protein